MPTQKSTLRDPEDRLIREEERRRRTGTSRAQYWREVKKGLAPAPIKMTARDNAWWLSEIDAYIDAKPRGFAAPVKQLEKPEVRAKAAATRKATRIAIRNKVRKVFG